MSRGVLLFAHNNQSTDYYSMAAFTASRINKYLDLPVSVVTDQDSISDLAYTFDQTIIATPDTSNFRKKTPWINKGRFKAFDFTPYDDTILLDTDYLINSNKLLNLFQMPSDIVCHNKSKYFFDSTPSEKLHDNGFTSLWATVIRFEKTKRAEQLFSMIEMIQNNYEHYSDLYHFNPNMFRNDYALTIALRTVNGQIECAEDYIPWTLTHVNKNTKIIKETDTQYLILHDSKGAANARARYIRVANQDFHILNKDNFMELTV